MLSVTNGCYRYDERTVPAGVIEGWFLGATIATVVFLLLLLLSLALHAIDIIE